MELEYDFVPMGYVATPESGKLYVDVGNAFCSGVLDHHHPDAPDACTAMLVLNHPEYVMDQVEDDHLTIIPHQYPDLDAITGAWLARLHALGKPVWEFHQQWADYVCMVDRGFTTLDPAKPVTPYSVFMMRIHLLRKSLPEDVQLASREILKVGFDFLDKVMSWLEAGNDIENGAALIEIGDFDAEVDAIDADLQAYRGDIQRAELFAASLPLKSGEGKGEVPGLWIEKPESAMFKSWARGDTENAHDSEGFVFLGIQVSDERFILSVDPSSDVYLKGLGDELEKAEAAKRKELGLERHGENRPGYDSPDPWYDGRSPLHNYTIVDSPRNGTMLCGEELRTIFNRYMNNLAIL